MITVIQLHVVGEEKLYGAGCEIRESNALRCLPGVRDVRASTEALEIVVTIDPSASCAQMYAWLQQLGDEVPLCIRQLLLNPLRTIGAKSLPTFRVAAASARGLGGCTVRCAPARSKRR